MCDVSPRRHFPSETRRFGSGMPLPCLQRGHDGHRLLSCSKVASLRWHPCQGQLTDRCRTHPPSDLTPAAGTLRPEQRGRGSVLFLAFDF